MQRRAITTRSIARAMAVCATVVVMTSCDWKLPDAPCGSCAPEGEAAGEGEPEQSESRFEQPSLIGERAPFRTIAPTDENLRFEGRWSRATPSAPRCAWSGCSVVLRFDGSRVVARLSGTGRTYVAVQLDARAPVVVPVGAGDVDVEVASGLAFGAHTLRISKRTEAGEGDLVFRGLDLEAARPLQPMRAPTHRIEVVGDSITCGYGNEGAGPECPYTPETEDATRAYGALAARAIDAEYSAVAWSGKGVYRNYNRDDASPTIPQLYDLALPQSGERWDFGRRRNDAVVVNLGTNDFGADKPPREAFVGAYARFLQDVRGKNPDAEIVVVLGPMLSDGYPQGARALSTAREMLQAVVAQRHDAGDGKVSMLEMAQQGEEGLGCDYHPGLRVHAAMAQKLAAHLQARFAR